MGEGEHVGPPTQGALTDTAALAQSINQAGGAKGVAASVKWLTESAADLQVYASVEDLAVQTGGGDGPFIYHLVQVRAELAHQLWRRRLFVGVTVLDELLFSAVRQRSSDPVLDVLAWLADSPLTRPAYVLYPLHSFGLLGAGLLFRPDELTSERLAREYGVAVCAQRNRMTDVVAWLEQVHAWFGVNGQVPADLLQHWCDSRNCSWLERNALLAVRVHSLSGSYYENQRLLVDRLHIATTFLAGLAVRQPGPADDTSRPYSSRSINNWQTLDIHHYIVMEADPDSNGWLTGDSVPISRDAVYLAELGDLPVDLKLDHWNRPAGTARGAMAGA